MRLYECFNDLKKLLPLKLNATALASLHDGTNRNVFKSTVLLLHLMIVGYKIIPK
jgi:hypothetical protein